MSEDLDLLRRVVEEPVAQMILAEVVSPAHARDLAHQIREWCEAARPVAELSFDANKDDGSVLWECCQNAVKDWTEANPGLLLVRDESLEHVRIAHGATEKPTSIGFWRTMNQLREKWDALPSQTLFLVTHEQYFFLTTEADHFKRWIPLKLHLPSPQQPAAQRRVEIPSGAFVESTLAFTTLDDLEDQEAARQNWDAYQERLRHALERGESPQSLARRYYLPLMAAAVALQRWPEAANYDEKISKSSLSKSQELRWLRLRSRLEEAQGDIAEAVATAEERLRLAEELEEEKTEDRRKQRKPELPYNTLSALFDLFLFHDRQKNFDKAEHWLLQGLNVTPNDITFLSSYASFLKNVRQDYEKAEEFYRRALEADPKHAGVLVNYANFLKDVRQDYEKAEEFYRRALKADPKNAIILVNYAIFFSDVRQDYEEAEEFHRRALEADPRHAGALGRYAVFLCLRRHDFDQAAIYFRRAMEAAPDDPQMVVNFTALLLMQGQEEEGRAMLEKAAAMPNLSEAQQVALAFHRYIHFPAESPSALKALKRVLKAGKRAKDWTFDLNIERAQQEGHPNVALLKALASVITEKKPLKSLDSFVVWKIA